MMEKTEHDGFWSAIEALGGQYVPPSLQAAVAETRQDFAQLELKLEAAVEKVEAVVGLVAEKGAVDAK
jgi:hypothetical protein